MSEVLAKRSLRAELARAIHDGQIDSLEISADEICVYSGDNGRCFDLEDDLEAYLRGQAGPHAEAQPLTDERLILRVLGEHFAHFEEIWLNPAIRKCVDVVGDQVKFVKRAIRSLEDMNAIRVEQRVGESNEYSVIILNKEHPLIKEEITF